MKDETVGISWGYSMTPKPLAGRSPALARALSRSDQRGWVRLNPLIPAGVASTPSPLTPDLNPKPTENFRRNARVAARDSSGRCTKEATARRTDTRGNGTWTLGGIPPSVREIGERRAPETPRRPVRLHMHGWTIDCIRGGANVERRTGTGASCRCSDLGNSPRILLRGPGTSSPWTFRRPMS